MPESSRGLSRRAFARLSPGSTRCGERSPGTKVGVANARRNERGGRCAPPRVRHYDGSSGFSTVEAPPPGSGGARGGRPRLQSRQAPHCVSASPHGGLRRRSRARGPIVALPDLPPLSPPKIGGNNLTISKMGGKQCAQLWDPLQAKALTPSAPAPTAGAYGASTGAGFVVDPTRALCSSFEKVSRPSEQS